MSKKRYRTVSLPEELFEKIEAVIESKEYGYSSVTEFIKELVRERLRELGYKV